MIKSMSINDFYIFMTFHDLAIFKFYDFLGIHPFLQDHISLSLILWLSRLSRICCKGLTFWSASNTTNGEWSESIVGDTRISSKSKFSAQIAWNTGSSRPQTLLEKTPKSKATLKSLMKVTNKSVKLQMKITTQKS